MRNTLVAVSLALGAVTSGCLSYGMGRIQPGSDVKLPLTPEDAAKGIALNTLLCAVNPPTDRGKAPGRGGTTVMVGEVCVARVDSNRIVRPPPARVP